MWKDLDLGIQVDASTGAQIAGAPAALFAIGYEVLVLVEQLGSWGLNIGTHKSVETHVCVHSHCGNDLLS